MLEEVGVVKEVTNNQITIQTELKNACHACAQKSHCGTGVIARAVANRISDVVVNYEKPEQSISVGQKVRLGVAEEKLLTASSVVYLVPLLALILGAVIGQELLPALGFTGEGWVIGFTAFWVWLAYRFIRVWTRTLCRHQFEPVFLGVASSDEKSGNLQ